MSEEEIVKYLKNVIKTIQESDMLFDEPVNIRCGITMKEAMQGLIDLYNKEKEKNRELEQRINKTIEFINNDDVYFTDGENWENVLYIESILKGE